MIKKPMLTEQIRELLTDEDRKFVTEQGKKYLEPDTGGDDDD